MSVTWVFYMPFVDKGALPSDSVQTFSVTQLRDDVRVSLRSGENVWLLGLQLREDIA